MFRRTHDTRIDGTCQRGLLVSSRGFRRVSPVRRSPGTKIRAELIEWLGSARCRFDPAQKIHAEVLWNGVRFLHLQRGSSTSAPPSHCHELFLGLLVANNSAFPDPSYFYRVFCGTYFSDVLQLWYCRIVVMTGLRTWSSTLLWKVEVRAAVGMLLCWFLWETRPQGAICRVSGFTCLSGCGFRCSRGFCQVYGTSTQRAPSQEPVEQLLKATIVVESPAGTLERSILAGIPSVATGRLSAAGFIAESLTEVTSCMPAVVSFFLDDQGEARSQDSRGVQGSHFKFCHPQESELSRAPRWELRGR